MTDEPAEIRRPRGWTVTEMAREDLDLFAVEDLKERIALLEAEIERCRAQVTRKTATRSAADALFSRRDD
jgi:uncharacterized small protein (DUF1192 family)